LFSSSGTKNGKHIKEHFERWGWINFLKSIAKTKVFDLPLSQKNSIECTRQASLFDVLMYASEEKDYNEAQWLDHEAAMAKYR